MTQSPHRLRLFSLVLILAVLLAACNTPTTVSLTATPAAVVEQASPTPTTPPTATPEPDRALLVAPPGSEARAQSTEALLKEAAGMQVEVLSQAAAGDLSAGVRLVVLLEAPQNLEQLLAAAPQAQFVIISAVDVTASANNLSVIRVRPETQAFLAGYVAELASGDWRAGGLLPSETLAQAFLAGGHYWCGRCTPLYPPLVLFPITAVLPPGSAPAEWQAAAGGLAGQVLEVIYVSPEATSYELILALVGQKLRMVGSQPPPVEATALWVATVQMDELATLRELLPDLLAGQGGQTVNAALVVRDVNPNLLSAGRQRLVEETRKALENGLISPLPVQ